MSKQLKAFNSQFTRVKFDPRNKEHLQAYNRLVNGLPQHPTLRFHLEDPFLDVVHMMERKIATEFLRRKQIQEHE